MTDAAVIRPGQEVAVVGGGLLGLTVALRLAEAGVRVSVFEGAAELGGLAARWEITASTGCIAWDRYYHVTLASDVALRGLLRDLDLDQEVAWTTTRTGYFADGRLSPVGTPREFLMLPGLSPIAKVRLAATIGRGALVRDWRALERVSVERWLTRWSGAATFRRFWVPLLEAKLGGAWLKSNAAFVWATIQRLTAARRAGIGDEQFGAVPGGYGRVLEVLAERLRASGVVLNVGTPVTAIASRHDRGVEVTTGIDHLPFDHAVITTTPGVAAGLCVGLAPAVAERMRAVRYQGIVCASVVLRRPLSPFYLTYLMDDLPFTAVVEMTAMIPVQWLNGHSLVYLPRYVSADDPVFQQSDDEIESDFIAGLDRIHPLAPDDVLAVRVARVREVFPLPVLHYSELVPNVETGIDGVHLVSSAQIVNGTLNVDETVARGERGVRELLGGSEQPMGARGDSGARSKRPR